MQNYENCEIRFLDIANIHVMRDSLKKLHSELLRNQSEGTVTEYQKAITYIAQSLKIFLLY